MEIRSKHEIRYKFIIVGLGATGSQLLPFLTQLLNNFRGHQLFLIDGDYVERKNLDNQKFLEADIDRPKVEALAERYQSVYPELDLCYSVEYIKDTVKLKHHLESAYNDKNRIPVLISCVDNNASRKIFDQLFHDESVPELIYIDSGNGTTDRIGQIVTGYKEADTVQDTEDTNFYKTKRVPNIRLNPVCDVFPTIRDDEDDIESHTGCSRVSDANPQNIGTNIYAAANLFMVLNNIVSFNQIPTQMIYFDAEKAESIARTKVDAD